VDTLIVSAGTFSFVRVLYFARFNTITYLMNRALQRNTNQQKTA